jgi:hypothetical protein
MKMAGKREDRGITINSTGLGALADGIVLWASSACAFGAAALPGHHDLGETSFGEAAR